MKSYFGSETFYTISVLYKCVCVSVCVYVYIYTCIHTHILKEVIENQ